MHANCLIYKIFLFDPSDEILFTAFLGFVKVLTFLQY